MGWLPAIQAGIAEFLLFCCLSGFTGAAVQRIRHLRPEWLARVLILGAIPALTHLSEFLLHTALATPARRSAIVVSLGLSVVSEAFTWHVMRQGAMLAGPAGASLSADLRRMPALVWGFVLTFARR